ncbi:disrupted in schizophrenia 1 protein isoform X2 [Anguilla anguilla]|uniref:disrupted in schizophrenia 1 protein isoform X2 n=1 Tax=Anguilla anguilla TaxID=7936 RepID=UPI0015B0EB53|nr:disrupted in schizophrenia 1 protein isoform X2 [Anguilla anguilla]
MFAGLVRLESQARSTSNTDSTHLPLDWAMGRGASGAAPGAAPGVVSSGGGSRRKLGRRPGYMREQEEGRRPLVNPAQCAPLDSGRASHPPPPSSTASQGGQHYCHSTPSVCDPAPSDRPLPPSSSGPTPSDRPLPQNGSSPTLSDRPLPHSSSGSAPSHRSLPQISSSPTPLHRPLPHSSLRCSRGVSPCGADSLAPSAGDQFTSSFSFIRLSLTSEPTTDCTPPSPSTLGSPPGDLGPGSALPEQSVTAVTDKPADPAGGQWVSREGRGDPAGTPELKDLLPDSDSCSLSVDSSDSASASSVTSGYESATPCGDGWDALLKRYEGILQDCLHSNRRNAQIEAMMLKLQRLQQKAVLEDDYDTAEHFGQKLEELRQEKSVLQLGLPSRHPAVSHFLQRLRVGVSAALQERAGSHSGERQELAAEERGQGSPQDKDLSQDPRKRREHLLQEKKRVQEEMQALRRRLQELQGRSQRLEEELLQEEQLEEGVGPALRSCSPAQLQELSRVLDDLVTSEHRAHICSQLPPLLLRLVEQEAALKASIKETSAKVLMSQRLGGGLQRKVSASETQLLALHEAKLAAISGSDFSSARELKVELKALCGERERLESLARRLQALSSASSRELARMKSEHGLLQHDLQHRRAQYESMQRENTLKYIELLEDKLHSCGNSLLERVWEADLEVCHLLVRAPSSCRSVGVEAPPTQDPPPEPHPKQGQDCAMLTALGGRWCTETGLQHSEFTKKLEEFLFCMEDSQDPCDVAAEVTEVTEQCELIGRRLESLEEQLQTAILDRDPTLVQSLEEEVQEVKATLQAMQRHLEEEEEDDLEEREGEEDEDHYFSDSWTI